MPQTQFEVLGGQPLSGELTKNALVQICEPQTCCNLLATLLFLLGHLHFAGSPSTMKWYYHLSRCNNTAERGDILRAIRLVINYPCFHHHGIFLVHGLPGILSRHVAESMKTRM